MKSLSDIEPMLIRDEVDKGMSVSDDLFSSASSFFDSVVRYFVNDYELKSPEKVLEKERIRFIIDSSRAEGAAAMRRYQYNELMERFELEMKKLELEERRLAVEALKKGDIDIETLKGIQEIKKLKNEAQLLAEKAKRERAITKKVKHDIAVEIGRTKGETGGPIRYDETDPD